MSLPGTPRRTADVHCRIPTRSAAEWRLDMNIEYGKPNTAGKVINIVIYIFLVLLAAIYVLPLLWVLMTSVKDDKILMISPWAFPEHLMWGNYSFAWTKGHLGSATLNSFIVCVTTLVLSMVIGAMAAFAISRMRWKGSKLMMTYFLTGMMIPVR